MVFMMLFVFSESFSVCPLNTILSPTFILASTAVSFICPWLMIVLVRIPLLSLKCDSYFVSFASMIFSICVVISAWFAFIFEPIMFIWVALREILFPA